MKFIVLMVLSMLCYVAIGQKVFEPAKVKGTPTGKYITVEDIDFPILKTINGKNFVMGVSQKTGNPYAIYIGEPTQYEYEGHQVWQNNDKYYYFKLTPNGYPSRRNLDVVE